MSSPMSAITSHPNEALVLAYAAGALEPRLALVVSAHLVLCSHCRALCHEAEETGGILIDAMVPVAMSDDALMQVMARIEGKPAATAIPAEFDQLPPMVRDAIAASGKKMRARKRGVAALDLNGIDAKGEGRLTLYRIMPGAAVPHHGHKGSEITLVLTGAFADETGIYRAGDVAVGAPSIHHRPRAEPGEVCFALAYTDAPLAFSGFLGAVQRVLRPFGIGG